LFTISKVINHDLVRVFCLPTKEEQETKVVLHIEVEKGKVKEVLKFIENKQLYDILSKE
jgi:hypothetical protein